MDPSKSTNSIKPVTLTVSPAKAVKLQIVPPKPSSTLVVTQTAPSTKKSSRKVKSPVVSDDSDDSGTQSSSEEDGYYVELTLSCVNDEDGEITEHNVMFNFETEENYIDQGQNGFDELEETYFQDAISQNYPGWTYDGGWEEHTIHGSELPDDYDGEVININ